MNIYVYPNRAPVNSSVVGSQSGVAGHSFSYTINPTLFSDPDGEAITYSISSSPTASWLNFDSTTLVMSGTPTVNTDAGIYTISIYVNDTNSNSAPGSISFTLTITANQAPTMPGTATVMTDGKIGALWLYVYDKSWNSDPEGEMLAYTCSSNDTNSWLSCSQNTTHILFSGISFNNADVGTYQISVTISDPFPSVNNYTWIQTFSLLANDPPVIGSMTDQSLVVPEGLTWSFGSSLTSDPESLSYTKSLEVDGSTTIPSWLVYDLTTFDFGLISSSNAYSGVHIITVVVTDTFNAPVRKSFTLTINQNQAPQKIKSIPDYGVVNYNQLSIQFEPITTLFSDPEGKTMTPMLMQANGNALPSFLSYNQITNVLSGTPLVMHVGEWPISYIAVDNDGQNASITFKIIVKRKFIIVMYSMLL